MDQKGLFFEPVQGEVNILSKAGAKGKKNMPKGNNVKTSSWGYNYGPGYPNPYRGLLAWEAVAFLLLVPLLFI
ncbi:hypothetical protein [Paenibacillus lemnae]|uniref:hypothetical protein n=1 Tax=Paenibacillus lemnae TaxID=1330551 RepID=UPI001FE71912|nr:hypothetical protein [Paenibacillus lemnae]